MLLRRLPCDGRTELWSRFRERRRANWLNCWKGAARPESPLCRSKDASLECSVLGDAGGRRRSGDAFPEGSAKRRAAAVRRGRKSLEARYRSLSRLLSCAVQPRSVLLAAAKLRGCGGLPEARG